MPRWLKRKDAESSFPKDTPLSSIRFVILDTELTSLNARTNRLLSVGAIAMKGSRIVLGEQFYAVVNPGVSVPEQGVLIHKLRPTDVQNGQSPTDALRDLGQFIEGSVLVGHFAEVDIKILRKEMAQTGQQLTNPAICTARVHRWIVQKQRYTEDQFDRLENVSLATLAKIYNLDVHEAHHALDDAFVTARLWQKLLHVLETQNITSFGQLLKIGAI